MATTSEALAIAVQHHQAGRLPAAEQVYRQILLAEPNQVDAIHLLGVIAHQVGNHEVAIEYIRRAIGLKGDAALFHNNLGEAYRALGRIPEAVACYRRTVELKPDFTAAHNNLGNAWKILGNLEEAVACYRRTVELKPDFAEAHNNLGTTLKDQGKLDEAIVCYRRALKLRPDYAVAHNNLGAALQDQGKLDEAIACYRRAIELKPDFAAAHYNIGVTCKDQGKPDEAIASYHRAVELKPDFAEAYYNLGVAFVDQGKLDEAVACYRRAVELKPDYVEAHINLGSALKNQGKLDEAIACYRRALQLTPAFAGAHSNLLLTLQYCTGVTPAALAEAHAEYELRFAAPLRAAIVPHEKVHSRQGRLRLGFVSPDLGWHPVGFFLVRVLENLGQDQYETTCYSDRTVKDDLTHRLQAATTHWRDAAGLSDQRLAEQIRADRIDILFDLAGHTAHNRLLVFARKPAPIQITWIGYEGTTGLTMMDYLLADHHVVPEGSEQYYREHVLRMPEGYVCYDPPQTAPLVSPLPAGEKGEVTFGSFNNLAKITLEVVKVWAQILRRVPRGRLLLKYKGLSDASVQQRYRELFANYGVEPERLMLLPPSSYSDYLATYHQVDLALDPFPFSGSATTCEALWMGVPVVTCPFETFASRHSLSHLSSVGVTETIAHDLDEYVELAVALAGDLPRLAALRASLRQRMADSPLCDGKRFATNLTSMLQNMWEQRIG